MKAILLITMLAFGTLTSVLPAQTPAPTNDEPSGLSYEELPELRASEILRPEFLQGDHFKVAEVVPTFSGANHFSIDSDFGVFEAGRK